MIWFILFLLAIAALVYVGWPLLTPNMGSTTNDSLSEYREKIAEIDRQIEAGHDDAQALRNEKAALQRMALLLANETPENTPALPTAVFVALAIAFTMSSGLLYSQLGSPESVKENVDLAQELEELPLDQLVLRLEKSIESDPANPNGWILYARSLVTLGRHEDALKAYDEALVLTNSDPKVVDERASALRYIDRLAGNQQGPSAAEVEAAMALSPADRAKMIESMVESLSAKLVDNPDDEQGWIRLIKSRRVLDQTELVDKEIERMREVYVEQPDTIARILTAAGQDTP